MDPITTALTAALAAGAATGVTDVAKKAVAEGYDGLKSLLHKNFGKDSEVWRAVQSLEANPDSGGGKETLEAEVKASKVAADTDLLVASQALLKLVKSLAKKEHHIQVAIGNNNAQADGGSTASVTISGHVPGGPQYKG